MKVSRKLEKQKTEKAIKQKQKKQRQNTELLHYSKKPFNELFNECQRQNTMGI